MCTLILASEKALKSAEGIRNDLLTSTQCVRTGIVRLSQTGTSCCVELASVNSKHTAESKLESRFALFDVEAAMLLRKSEALLAAMQDACLLGLRLNARPG